MKLMIGQVTGFHGLKGELKILSDINLKEKVFKIGNILEINNKNLIIKTYRIHKKYDLISFENYEDINLIEDFFNKEVFVDKNNLELKEKEYLEIELIGFKVYENDLFLGKVIDIQKSISYNYIVINNSFLIPLIKEYIIDVNLKEKVIKTKDAKYLNFKESDENEN